MKSIYNIIQQQQTLDMRGQKKKNYKLKWYKNDHSTIEKRTEQKKKNNKLEQKKHITERIKYQNKCYQL